MTFQYTWENIDNNSSQSDLVVIHGQVFDLTNFIRYHPGGTKVIEHYGNQDATEAFIAFHKEFDKVFKYSKIYKIGDIDPTTKHAKIKKDFEDLRLLAKEMNLFEPNLFFFLFHAAQIIFFQTFGYLIFLRFGYGLWPFICATFCLIVAQGQASWTMHDYGHSSVLEKTKYNKYIQYFFLGFIKGGSVCWWNHLHNQHHAKPNVIDKDPDTRMKPIFVLGEHQPRRTAEKDEKYLFPFNMQHYLFPIFAPLLFPIYFQLMTFRHVIVRRLYLDLAAMLPMYIYHFAITYFVFKSIPLCVAYWFFYRMIDSAWFIWVSQCNHIVMDIHDDEKNESWFTLQLRATCNLCKSSFNDWFTGHLNFQIEHHLFPTMPRHNYYKIQPHVQSMCRKYNIPYVLKSLRQAFWDILSSLKRAGAIWKEAFDDVHNAK